MIAILLIAFCASQSLFGMSPNSMLPKKPTFQASINGVEGTVTIEGFDRYFNNAAQITSGKDDTPTQFQGHPLCLVAEFTGSDMEIFIPSIMLPVDQLKQGKDGKFVSIQIPKKSCIVKIMMTTELRKQAEKAR